MSFCFLFFSMHHVVRVINGSFEEKTARKGDYDKRQDGRGLTTKFYWKDEHKYIPLHAHKEASFISASTCLRIPTNFHSK